MNISDLIARLETIKEEFGDLPVYIAGYSTPLQLGNRSIKVTYIREPEGRERVSRFDDERGHTRVCKIF